MAIFIHYLSEITYSRRKAIYLHDVHNSCPISHFDLYEQIRQGFWDTLADCIFLHMSINIRLQEIEYYVHKMMQTEGVFMAFYIKANIIVNTRISFP